MTASSRSCPRCDGVTLDTVRDGGHEVDVCAECRGLWLDAHEWSGVVGPAASASRLSAHGAGAGDPASAPACPSCAAGGAGHGAPRLQPRVMIGAPEVALDACPACHGAWLDGGELPQLKKALAAGRARVATTPPPLTHASGPAQQGPAQQGPTMGQAMGATAVSALGFLLQAAMRPPRRRGFSFGRRRGRSGLGGGLQLLGWLLRLLRR